LCVAYVKNCRNLGNVKVLNMENSTLKGETFGVPFFQNSSLEILYLCGFTISIEDLAAVLDTFCQALWFLCLDTYESDAGLDRNIILFKTTALRELSIQAYGHTFFTYSLISQLPDFTRLKLTAIDATDEVTRGFGEKLEHLMVCGCEKLPRMGCMNLKSLHLWIWDDINRENIFDGEAGDLSNIRCLTISSAVEGEHGLDLAISVMRSYNIGRNLEGLIHFKRRL
jgi:hypothetical protein